MEHFLIYLVIGACAGVLSGLLGVGGGVVIVPALVIIFKQLGAPAAVVLHMAIGTSLATIVVTSLSAIYAHHRRGTIQWHIARPLAPWLAAGSLGGATVASYLHSDHLRVVLVIFIFAVALQIGLGYKPAPHRLLPGRVGMGLVGSGIGLLSAIFGIGGGVMTVPFLVWRNVPIRLATATSVVCGLVIALAGAAGFMVAGSQADALNARLTQWSTGFVSWPAFAGIVAASVPTAPLGAWLAQVLATRWLEIVFAVILGLTALKLLTL